MLTTRDVAYLACRILALSLIILGLREFFTSLLLLVTQLWQTLRLGSDWSTSAVIALLAVLLITYFGLVWLVWSNARWLSHKIVPEERNNCVWPRVRLQDLQVATFSAIGLVCFIFGLQTLTTVAVGLIRVLQLFDPQYSMTDWLLSGEAVSALVQVVLGLVLMIGSRGIVRLIDWLRNAGGPDLRSDADEVRTVPQADEIS